MRFRASTSLLLLLTALILIPNTVWGQKADEVARQRIQWEQLSAEEKERCLKAYEQIQQMDPSVRKRLLLQVRKLTAEQKSRLGKMVKNYNQEDQEKRQRAKRAFRQRELWLKTQSPEDRQRFMTKDPELRKKHYAEKLQRMRKHLLNRIPEDVLDAKKRERLMKAQPEIFRQEFSRLIRAEVQMVVSDRTFHLINDFDALSPYQINAFLRQNKFPDQRDDLRLRYEELDDSEKRQFKGVLLKINRVFRMGRKPGAPAENGRPRPPRKDSPGPAMGPGKGERVRPAPEGSPRQGPPPRRKRPGSRPSNPGPRPGGQLEGAGLEIRDQQA